MRSNTRSVLGIWAQGCLLRITVFYASSLFAYLYPLDFN
ncbi:hypothetical protein AVDCRST_MAG94-1001 [uncultured Leptolyngbya sp.]|uniref:Uncharacterized protein n=1 Tax=uncultured Leptolyngbya sp. TaxID=332963 RepID=A0A6J4KUJ4_9CYAN|nr:hypothetical protein AVDCRST_MAG94-1001 [uncultured Leptolyngbya sp.]